MPVTLQPFDAPLGAEVGGFDPRRIEPADFEALQQALARHGVLVMPDQHLTPAELVAFSRRFGELEYHVLDQYWLPEQPEVYVISNIVENGKPIGNPREGFGWHTDLSYMPFPTAYTFLYGSRCRRKARKPISAPSIRRPTRCPRRCARGSTR